MQPGVQSAAPRCSNRVRLTINEKKVSYGTGSELGLLEVNFSCKNKRAPVAVSSTAWSAPKVSMNPKAFSDDSPSGPELLH